MEAQGWCWTGSDPGKELGKVPGAQGRRKSVCSVSTRWLCPREVERRKWRGPKQARLEGCRTGLVIREQQDKPEWSAWETGIWEMNLHSWGRTERNRVADGSACPDWGLRGSDELGWMGLRPSYDWDGVAESMSELWKGENRGTGHSVEWNKPGLLRGTSLV